MRLLPLLCSALLVAAPLAAQQSPGMVSGAWRGWVLRPEVDSIRATFFVDARGKHISILMRTPNNPDYGMSDVKLKDDVLTFTWAMGLGSLLSCRLSRRGGTFFDGLCLDTHLDDNGHQARLFMSMYPPRDTLPRARRDSGG